MAQLKRGSVIQKSTRKEVIATESDLSREGQINVPKTDYPLGNSISFTPSVEGNTTAGNHSYAIREGSYIKFANLVFFTINIVLSSKDPNMYGNTIIGGLPFISSQKVAVSVARKKGFNIGGYEQLSGLIIKDCDYIWLYKGSLHNGTWGSIGSGAVTSDFNLMVSGIYEIGDMNG